MENNKSKNKLKDVSKRMIDLNRWLECSVKLLKDKGIIFFESTSTKIDHNF